jgi:hypothetical protein
MSPPVSAAVQEAAHTHRRELHVHCYRMLASFDEAEEDRRPGRFLITGSANLLTLRGAQESLAGRAETVELFGLSQGELIGRVETFINRLMGGDELAVRSGEFQLARSHYAAIACAGSYPEPRLRDGNRRRTWFTNYLNRVLTRDATAVDRSVGQVLTSGRDLQAVTFRCRVSQSTVAWTKATRFGVASSSWPSPANNR